MIIELARVLLGVMMVCFHRPIAQFMHVREQELNSYLSQRGLNIPSFPSLSVITDVYFFLGIAVFLLSLAKFWVA